MSVRGDQVHQNVALGQYLTTTEAMQRAGVSRTTLRNAIADGRLHAIMRGRSLFIPASDVDRLKVMSRTEAGKKGARRKWEKYRQSELQRLSSVPGVGEPLRRSAKAEQALFAEAEAFAGNILRLKEQLHSEKPVRGRPRKQVAGSRRKQAERMNTLQFRLAEFNRELSILLETDGADQPHRSSGDGFEGEG